MFQSYVRKVINAAFSLISALLITLPVAGMIALPAISLIFDFPAIAVADAVPPATLSQPMVRVPGNVLPALKQATPIPSAKAEANKPLVVTMVLRRDHQKAFERYFHEVYDPHSPNYHHWLTQTEIAARFGPSRAEYDSVLDYLRGRGFKLVEGSKNRLTLTLRGTRAMAERAFDVNIRDYRIGKHTFYANDRDPALPQRIASNIEAVGGLSDLASPSVDGGLLPAIAKTILFSASDVYVLPIGFPVSAEQLFLYLRFTAALVRTALAAIEIPIIESLLDSTPATTPAEAIHPKGQSLAGPTSCTWPDNGTGQTIGLLEFGSFNASDVEDFLSLMGLPATLINDVSKVDVNGGTTPGTSQTEVLLDIDVILAAAPGAKVVVYDAPFAGAGASFQPLLNKMINDGVNIISNSWAYCEDETTKADVDSIDSLFQQAGMAGISVFNAAGDSGSTCLDGAQDTVGVPADSPNATAVGGTSLTVGPGDAYQSETWWNGLNETPTTGQGGYGISKFVPVPAYQSGIASGGRSVPDVSVNADPASGYEICEAAGGGCPTGLLNGGTSGGAPSWAAFQAILNQSVGHPLGFVNPIYYGFANTSAFHNAASMGTDFAHVGLGSPNLDQLHLKLCGQTVGTPDSGMSEVVPLLTGPEALEGGVPADGATAGEVDVTLVDAGGNPVGGKTVTLAASSGSSTISPSSGTTSANSGSFIFTVKDLTPESVTYSATDTTDNVALTQQTTVPFVVPPATGGTISASLGSVTANGSSSSTITVMLQDSLGRPTPGKLVTLDQGSGHSAITAPSPEVTNGSGQAAFTVTDVDNENVIYTATDVTDGNLPVPGSATVAFGSGSGGCYSQPYVTGTANPANGYLVSNFASGFTVSNGSQGFSYYCWGATGMAFDASNNLYVTDWPTDDLYRFGTSGGVASAATLVASLSSTGGPLTGVAVDPAGNLFVSLGSVGANPKNGEVVQINPSTGAAKVVASGIPCANGLAVNPSIPALFVDDVCSSGTASPNIWEITGMDGASPTTTVYSATPQLGESFGITVAPNGTLYVLYNGTAAQQIARISNSNPPVATMLTNASGNPISTSGSLGLAAAGMQTDGDAQFLIGPFAAQDGLGAGVQTLDLTGSSPTPASLLTTSYFSGLESEIIGPDGCLYVAGGPTVSKVTNADGSCDFGPKTFPPTISLTPTSVSPNPALGSSQSFTATLHYASPLSGVPVKLMAVGANSQILLANTNSSGQATFSYTGVFKGQDNVIASATVNSTSVTSNTISLTWGTGKDVTFLTLNPSPKGSMPGQTVTVMASLSDISQNPATVVTGQTVNFTLGSASCSGATDAFGIASCTLTPGGSGMETLNASFAGTSTLVASNASTGFTVLVGGGPIPNPGGTVALVTSGDNSGKPGSTVDVGTFNYTATGGTNLNDQTLSSVSLSVSDPNIFESLTVTPSSRTPVTVTAPNVAKMTTFNFTPGLTVMPSQEVTFTVTGVLKGSTARLELGGVAFAGVKGVPADSNAPMQGLLAMLLGMCLVGAAVTMFASERRRRVTLIAGLVLVLAATAIGCSGGGSGSSGTASSPTSQQSVMSVGVSENGAAVTTSGTPLMLGTIKKT